MSVYLELNGAPVPAGDLSWYYFAPCGCCYGATVLDVGDRVLLTEEDAWQSFWSRSDQRRKKKSAGFRFELGLRADAERLLMPRCTHRSSGPAAVFLGSGP